MRPKILILGGGYGGLTTAIQLQRKIIYGEAEITLVNKHDYHYIATHLHQTAAGTSNAKSIKIQIKEVIDHDIVSFVKGEVVEINLKQKEVYLKDKQTLSYDILVIGLGSEVETFGIKGLREHAYAIRSINSVQLIREHIEYMFAKYKGEKADPKYLTFIIGGAGFTGIEFVGELANRVPELCKQFSIEQEEVKIINIEAAPKPLPGFDPNLVEYAIETLRKKGVRFILDTPIKEVNENGVVLENGEIIETNTVVWTGGVRGNKVIEQLDLEHIRARVKVDSYLRAPGYDNVFIIGDNSIVFNEKGEPYPPTAQIAIQQGDHVAKQITSYIRNGKMNLEKFDFSFRGTVASLGKRTAVGKIGRWKIAGLTAAFIKQMIDNKYLYSIGGLPLLLKKGKFME